MGLNNQLFQGFRKTLRTTKPAVGTKKPKTGIGTRIRNRTEGEEVPRAGVGENSKRGESPRVVTDGLLLGLVIVVDAALSGNEFCGSRIADGPLCWEDGAPYDR